MDLIFAPGTVALLVMLMVAALGLAIRPNPGEVAVKNRAESYLEREAATNLSEKARDLEGSFLQRAVVPLMRGLLGIVGRVAPTKTLDDLTHRLMLAGRPGNMTATDFLGLSVITAAVGLGLGILYARSPNATSQLRLLAPVIGGIVGYRAPNFWLGSKVKQRRETIQRALADALDMLTICVEAGLAFEASLQRVSEQWAGPLSEEFARMVAEIRLGVPRSQALRRLAQRCDTPDVTSFVAVLVQADSMGSSIASIIHSQADQIRTLRRQRAEEKANKAPIKMLIPMVLFIFPALFVVILGPAVPGIMSAFGGGF